MSCQMLKNVEKYVKMPIAFPDDDDCSMFVSNPAEKWQIEFSCLSVQMMHCGMHLLEEVKRSNFPSPISPLMTYNIS